MPSAEELMMAARCRLMSTAMWYGHMSMQMYWEEATDKHISMRTMYVTAQGGKIYCRWFREFVESKTVEELCGAIQHEIEHVLRMHLVRAGDGDGHQRIAWNIAADMCVNGTFTNPRIGYKQGDKKFILPLGDDSEKNMIWIPTDKDWEKDQTVEWYYNKIVNDKAWKDLIKKIKDGIIKIGTFDDHEQWVYTDMGPDEIRQLVADIVRESCERAKGDIPGHVMGYLKQLGKPLVNPHDLLRRYIGRHVGGRRKTYARRNRRRDEFGVPGHSSHAVSNMSVIVDTSGSITDNCLQNFFAIIESVSSHTKVSLLQWDHAFQGYTKHYRKNDWKNIKIGGRGGTDMAAPVEWLIEHKVVGDVVVMLTDGFCNYTDPKPFPMITCISDKAGAAPTWGNVIWMKGQHFEEGDN